MDEREKSAVRLKHWIDHNVDHLKGYREVADILEREGEGATASKIRDGIRLIEEANNAFRTALEDLPMPEHHSSGHSHHH